MHDEADLLRAICANPNDDTPRLAYADWLDEHASGAAAHGRDAQEMRDRARLIRAQVGLEQGTDPDRGGALLDDRRRVTLVVEANALLERHRAEWDRRLRDLGARVTAYRSGFPEEISIEAERFLANADRLFATSPLRGARIQALNARWVEALAESPYLANLLHLNLSGNFIGPAGARAVAASPHLGGLQNLDLGDNGIGDAGARALADSSHLRNLTQLNVSGNNIGRAGTRALAGAPGLASLTHLYLFGNDIGNIGADALARSPHLTNLTHLDLGGNDIGDAGAQSLASSPSLSHLTFLGLWHNDISGLGARAIAGSSTLTPEAKVSALKSAGFNRLASQVRGHQADREPDGP